MYGTSDKMSAICYTNAFVIIEVNSTDFSNLMLCNLLDIKCLNIIFERDKKSFGFCNF